MLGRAGGYGDRQCGPRSLEYAAPGSVQVKSKKNPSAGRRADHRSLFAKYAF